LVDKSKENQLDSEIAKRLDDLFGEGDPFSDEKKVVEPKQKVAEKHKPKEEMFSSRDEQILDLEEATADQTRDERIPDDSPLAELKQLVLSIDWEITEEALDEFLSQIHDLKAIYKNKKIIFMFLQLLGSLGVYIKTNRGNAHPRTFKILSSAFYSLEEVVLSKDMSEPEKKKLLNTEMDKYKQLRSQVSKKKAAKAGRQEVIATATEGVARTQAFQKKRSAQPKATEKVARKSLSPAESAEQSYADLAEAVAELKKFIHSELNALKQELRILRKSN
jgi:hypothetical protein